MAWCVLRVRPGYELAAVDWMNERAITAYTPSAKRRVRRRYPRTGHDVVEVAAFPGYAFASTDVRFVDTERCPGAVSLIDGLASDAEVQTVSFREAEGEFDLIPADAPPPAFMVGDRVVAAVSALAGLPVTVVGHTGGLVQVDVVLFGRSGVISVEADRLGPVGGCVCSTPGSGHKNPLAA